MVKIQFKIKAIFLLFFLVGSNCVVYSQQNFEESNKLNLPPGAVMPIKFEFIDYSYKLNNIFSSEVKSSEEKNFLYEFSEVDLVDMKANHADKYQYYMKANDFYKSLSDNVKSTYTINELWYIYSFDQQLKNKLLTVK